MISLVHHKGIAITSNYNGLPIIEAIYKCAQKHPDDYLLIYEKDADVEAFQAQLSELNHNAYFISNYNYTSEDLGYVEDSPFININKRVKYPTWLKGTALVCIHSKLVAMTAVTHSSINDYLYWLNSIGRLSRPLGVLNYQVPSLIQNEPFNDIQLYKFVKEHYKARWIFILLLCHLWYERRFPLIAFIYASFLKRKVLNLAVDDLQFSKEIIGLEEFKYDVIIPTMGRASYLKNVLHDLSSQTILPEKVIIIEQNADKNATTELDYLTTQSWPFAIEHEFIHQTGACNARNRAISQTCADWVLLFDDDNRFTYDIMERVFIAIKATGAKVLNLAYLQKGEVENGTCFKQWESFGSGCSIIHREVMEKCKFDMALEHGYGEDTDYGMQIRHAGYDIIYAPQIQLLHLKAPVGGFRKPYVFPWHNHIIQPKPSPQIMYQRKKNYTFKQLLGYKLVQLVKTYGLFGTKKPWKHYRKYLKAWKQSEKWAGQL